MLIKVLIPEKKIPRVEGSGAITETGHLTERNEREMGTHGIQDYPPFFLMYMW